MAAVAKKCCYVDFGKKIPCVIFWSPKLIAIPNDAFNSLLGARLEALGETMPEIWFEAWNIVSPIVQKALSGRASYFKEVPFTLMRHGIPQKAWFDYSISPLRNEANAIAGILITTIEKTENELPTWTGLKHRLDQLSNGRSH